MNKRDLLVLAYGMRTKSYEGFYRFAQNYASFLENMKRDVGLFWKCLEYCRDNCIKDSVKTAMGISGNGRVDDIRVFCDYVLGKEELRALDATQLNYLFGCCARISKAEE